MSTLNVDFNTFFCSVTTFFEHCLRDSHFSHYECFPVTDILYRPVDARDTYYEHDPQGQTLGVGGFLQKSTEFLQTLGLTWFSAEIDRVFIEC